MVSKDVDFNENFIGWNQQHTSTAEEVDLAGVQHDDVVEDWQVKNVALEQDDQLAAGHVKNEEVPADAQGNLPYDPEVVTQYPAEPRRPTRTRQKPQRFSPDTVLAMLTGDTLRNCDDYNPLTVRDALWDTEARQWKAAMCDKMTHIETRSVWTLVQPQAY
ncbi:hypothetical protein BWQ96_04353 [Gracilariopsis chorda]|uniref:Uncharacterized protein n=1 Tax=Gracilariopsis chorda TaxID=448386 RepID=A0A2V3IUV1_9FLOR|nr:hypothetical protein BWQ96_04353 [Gracilariopsis chorda]|eukprot:PXF45918.1 hypothetical protein BWQ96_04353 [Gracilariopsis chorda]